MNLTGKLLSVQRDWKSNRINMTFEVNEQPTEEINQIASCEKLSIEVKKFRQKRSLDANAYCWVLMTKIAEVVDSSKDEVYEEMLQKYGYVYQDDEGYIAVTVKAEVDMSKIQGHWKFLKTNGVFSSYLMIKGSSEYDSAEMAKFIDRIIDEAKDLGIETLPPEELERMKAEWNRYCKK